MSLKYVAIIREYTLYRLVLAALSPDPLAPINPNDASWSLKKMSSMMFIHVFMIRLGSYVFAIRLYLFLEWECFLR